MKMFVINQKKAANNHNLFGNVKVIHKYNVRFSLIADLQISQFDRSEPTADVTTPQARINQFTVRLIHLPPIQMARTERYHSPSSCISTSTQSH